MSYWKGKEQMYRGWFLIKYIMCSIALPGKLCLHFSFLLYIFLFLFLVFCLSCEVINNISMFAVSSAGMTEEITGDWSYYVYISLTLVPVYLAFRLIKSLGWQLFVNNWANIWTELKWSCSHRQENPSRKSRTAKAVEVRSHFRLPVRSGRVSKVESRTFKVASCQRKKKGIDCRSAEYPSMPLKFVRKTK